MNTTSVYTSTTAPREWYFPAKLKRLEMAIADARVQARRICVENGPTDSACAIAWEVVEELLSELAHERISHPPKTGFEQYVEAFPEADEARVYDV